MPPGEAGHRRRRRPAVARRAVKLRRELGRLDAVCLLISAIVVLDTLGAVARGGAQTLTWLAVVAGLCFVPAGLVIAELGAAFPIQGGPYARPGWPSAATPGRWSPPAPPLAALAVTGDDNSRYFSAALTLSIALLALANLVVFPALVRLRRSQPERPRPFRVPGGPAGALAAVLAVPSLLARWGRSR